MRRAVVIAACLLAVTLASSSALVRAGARPSSKFEVSHVFGHTLPASERADYGFLARAQETDDDPGPAGIRRMRVLVDRDLVPGWFANPDYGVCTREEVKGAYGLPQMERACGGKRLGGGYLARVAFADGHSEMFGAELFAARVRGQRGLLLHLYRLGSAPNPVINVWGRVFQRNKGPLRWGYRLKI